MSMALRYIKDDTTLMTFQYGQKAKKESEVVKKLAEKYHLGFEQMDISSLKSIFGKDNQLTNDVAVEESYQKSVVVPLRNALFLQIAMVYAYANGFDKIVLGSHLDDCVLVNGEYAFPDCSPAFFKAFELAMDMGTFRGEKHVKVETASLLGLHKQDLIRWANTVDKEMLKETWSCYKNGEHQCGVCDSCRNRKAAFAEAGIEDPTVYDE